jgi:hypothetical protein
VIIVQEITQVSIAKWRSLLLNQISRKLIICPIFNVKTILIQTHLIPDGKITLIFHGAPIKGQLNQLKIFNSKKRLRKYSCNTCKR